MNRHKSLYKLSHDHHHGLKLAQLIKKGAPSFKNLPSTAEGKAAYTLEFYNEHLVPHFHQEENVLYPLVKNKNKKLDDLFAEIFEEHKTISRLINDLKNKEFKEDILYLLGDILNKHIKKEEKELFMLIQETLSGEELSHLADLLEGENKNTRA
ncbi:MAG: hemerythrin domain-containing protein [Ignavibacteriaceae bacterium]